MKQEIVNINVFDIIPNKFQPRQKFDDNKLNELANSIKKYGILCPLILRKLGNKYEIIAGERRYKAAQMVGLQTVPCIVMELTDQESAEVALIENIQREDLSSIEEAKSYDNLMKNESISKDQISQSISKNIGSIESKLKLLELSDKAKDSLLNNLISEGHAKVLLKLNDQSKQNEVLDKIMNERLNVKEASEEVKKINSQTNNTNELNNNYQEESNSINNDIININNLNEPDLALEKNNINNALSQINLENEKGDITMNEFNNTMNNQIENQSNNQGLNSFQEMPTQNKFFPSLEDQTVNTMNQPIQNNNNQFNIPTFDPNQFNPESINNQTNLNMPINNMNQPTSNQFDFNNNSFEQPMNNEPNSFAGQVSEMNTDNNFNQMPINNSINQPQVPDFTNLNNNINSPSFDQNTNDNNPFAQPINNMMNNPFDMNNNQTNTQPTSNEQNPFIGQNIQMPTDNINQPINNNYGAGFAPHINQSNPAIDRIKAAVDELRANGFNIELSESDLMDSFQLIINVKK